MGGAASDGKKCVLMVETSAATEGIFHRLLF